MSYSVIITHYFRLDLTGRLPAEHPAQAARMLHRSFQL